MSHVLFKPSGVICCAAGLLVAATELGCAEGSGQNPYGISGGLGISAGAATAAGAPGVGGSSSTGAGATSGQGSGASFAGAPDEGISSNGELTFNTPWDWAGIVGTGQSLAVGDPGAARNTPAAAVRSLQQPHQNLKLSTAGLPWPIDPNDPALSMVPLVEPVGRLSPVYPSSWPTNIAGETPHAAMANQITALVKEATGSDYINVHGEVGENGQCLSFLVKGAAASGVNGHAYEATIVETTAITRLAAAEGKTYGVGAVIVTHGECDAGNTNYVSQLHQLLLDYAGDLATITGQTEPPILIVSQQNSVNDRAASSLAQWRIGEEYPDEVVCSGPKYQYAYSSDGVHMLVDGYQALGEKYAQVYYERVVLRSNWQPLKPMNVRRAGRVITVEFHVPVPPLAWEETFQPPHQLAGTEWRLGKGFEVRAGAAPVTISAVEIVGNAVNITCATDLPAAGVSVGYALVAESAAMTMPFAGTTRWGQLRDSDPFVGSVTEKPQPNFAVAFELTVP